MFQLFLLSLHSVRDDEVLFVVEHVARRTLILDEAQRCHIVIVLATRSLSFKAKEANQVDFVREIKSLLY